MKIKTLDPNITKIMRRHVIMNLELKRKLGLKRKLYYHPSGTKTKIFNLKIEKLNNLLSNIPTNNITELNEPIYTGIKLVSVKIGIPQLNPKKYKTCVSN